jgi:hypothetical protein
MKKKEHVYRKILYEFYERGEYRLRVRGIA